VRHAIPNFVMTDRVEFSRLCSASRLRLLQALCYKRNTDTRAVQDKPSVLVIAPGEDGRCVAWVPAVCVLVRLCASVLRVPKWRSGCACVAHDRVLCWGRPVSTPDPRRS